MTPTARATRMRSIVPAAPAADAQRSIPFDYTFRFNLLGDPNRPNLVHRSTITISVEASFTAVSIGYGVVPQVTPIIFGPAPLAPFQTVPGLGVPALAPASFRNISLGQLFDTLVRALSATGDVLAGETGPSAAFKAGIRLNPQFAELALANDGNDLLSVDTLSRLFQVTSAPSDEVQFLYALFDDGSGREFQSEPLLNIAGLGGSGGQRPFRYFARPISFEPRSTIRMEVTERSQFQGELHVSLHGYKVLGGAGTPTGRVLSPTGRRRRQR